MQPPSGIQKKNLIETANNVALGLDTPVLQPIGGYFGPTLLNLGGLQVSAPAPPIQNNASLFRKLSDLVTSKNKKPEWKFAQFNGDSLQWHEKYSQ